MTEGLAHETLAKRARHAVYGSVIVLAVIIALDDTSIRTGEAIASIVGAAFATLLAELYADYLAETIRSGHHPDGPFTRAEVRDGAAGFTAAILPVAFFILAAAGVLELDTAFNLAVWTGVGVIGLYAFVANRVAGLSVVSSLVVGAGFTVVGAVLVLVKSLA